MESRHASLRNAAAWRRIATLLLACAALIGGCGTATAQPRLTERALGDIATLAVPAGLEPERYAGYPDELMHREVFRFGASYFWASMGGVARYRQLMLVSVLAADAGDAVYAATPRDWPISYESRGPARTQPLGSGQLKTTEAVYALGVDRVAAVQYVYTDRARRLQILWHAVASQHDPATAAAQIERMAASFRLLRDPAPTLAERRAQPARDAAERERRRATARAMLAREGHATLQPGQPVWHRGAWLEWMDDPEPRYQLLVPLGRMRAAPPGVVVGRPRPLNRSDVDPGIGWREFADGAWGFSNRDNGYLPFKGIAAALAARRQDTGQVDFYYVRTVRVEVETDPDRLASLDWFFASVPAVQRRWREGTLVGPGLPLPDDEPR